MAVIYQNCMPVGDLDMIPELRGKDKGGNMVIGIIGID